MVDLKRAKYKIEWQAEAEFRVGEEIEISQLPDRSRIVFHKSNDKKTGKIFVEVDRPDASIARDKGRQLIEQFFNCVLIASEGEIMIRSIALGNLELLNPEDFKGELKTSIRDITQRVAITARLEQQTLGTAAGLLTRIDGLPQEQQDIIFRSLRWFGRAPEANEEDRFILRWISFEALFGLSRKPEMKGKGLIQDFINDFYDKDTAERILQKHKKTVEDLSNANLVGLGGGTPSEDLRKELEKNKDYRAILQKVALCIYEVRNHLFHKGRAHGLMQRSSSLLRDIIREYFNYL